MRYPAIVTKEGEFTLAEFPDCEGCQTFVRKGESIEESAQEALELWLDANLGRDSIPNRPSTVRIPKDAKVIEIAVSLSLAFRLELRWAREEERKTQAQFGKKLGMSQQQYAKLEGPRSNPTLGTIDRVAKVTGLGVHVTKERTVGLNQTPTHVLRPTNQSPLRSTNQSAAHGKFSDPRSSSRQVSAARRRK